MEDKRRRGEDNMLGVHRNNHGRVFILEEFAKGVSRRGERGFGERGHVKLGKFGWEGGRGKCWKIIQKRVACHGQK